MSNSCCLLRNNGDQQVAGLIYSCAQSGEKNCHPSKNSIISKDRIKTFGDKKITEIKTGLLLVDLPYKKC